MFNGTEMHSCLGMNDVCVAESIYHSRDEQSQYEKEEGIGRSKEQWTNKTKSLSLQWKHSIVMFRNVRASLDGNNNSTKLTPFLVSECDFRQWNRLCCLPVKRKAQDGKKVNGARESNTQAPCPSVLHNSFAFRSRIDWMRTRRFTLSMSLFYPFP